MMEKINKDMTEKYYTPEIDEFFEGFIYEEKSTLSGHWFNQEFSQPHPVKTKIKTGDIRVKFLDRADIESLEWTFIKTTIWSSIFQKKEVFIEKYLEQHCIKIDTGEDYPEDNKVFFDGTIRNKSELQKLMKQLGI